MVPFLLSHDKNTRFGASGFKVVEELCAVVGLPNSLTHLTIKMSGKKVAQMIAGMATGIGVMPVIRMLC